jgi:hypothetical protein
VTVAAPWNANGPLQFGHMRANATPMGFLPGAVDDVRIFHGVLTDQQIYQLYDH